jgi:hypothetical protein
MSLSFGVGRSWGFCAVQVLKSCPGSSRLVKLIDQLRGGRDLAKEPGHTRGLRNPHTGLWTSSVSQSQGLAACLLAGANYVALTGIRKETAPPGHHVMDSFAIPNCRSGECVISSVFYVCLWMGWAGWMYIGAPYLSSSHFPIFICTYAMCHCKARSRKTRVHSYSIINS